MLRTPPLNSTPVFATPQRPTRQEEEKEQKQIQKQQKHQQPKQFTTTPANKIDTRGSSAKYLPTPSSPYDVYSPFSPSLKSPGNTSGLSIETSFSASPFSSPAQSPINSLYGGPLTPQTYSSPISSPELKKYLPSSTLVSEDEVLYQMDDSVIDSKFKFDIKSSKIIGKGSYSTVLNCSIDDKIFAIKIPSSIKTSKVILKEMFNYKIIQNYLLLNDFNLEEFPILNTYGLTFLGKSQYPRARYGETLPCLISSSMTCALDTLISKTNTHGITPTGLSIGEQLWWKLVRQSVMALIALKDCHVVHMDLKPSNILFDGSNQDFKIADLTSAGIQEDVSKEYHRRVQDGLFFDLTLQYCAPELVFSPPACPNYQTDLYAMGLIWLYTATGEEPYSEILQNQSTSNFIYMNESIKKNKVLDVLSTKSLTILKSNPDAYKLIQMILTQRCSLETIVDLLNNGTAPQ